jgi:hypothetical protein
MKIRILKLGKRSRLLCLIASITLLLSVGFLDSAIAEYNAEEIDAKADAALEQFRASKNWEAGVDANIAIVAAGSGGALTNISGKDPIQAVVFDVKGLFFDFSLKGGKFSKLDK